RPPRQHSAASRSNVQNITDPMPGQTEWSVDNLPDILYIFRPTAPQVRSKNKMPMKPSPWGCGLNLQSPPMWKSFGLKRGCAWIDASNCTTLQIVCIQSFVSNNALQQRGVRFRQAFNILSWGSGNKQTKVVADQLEQKMQVKGIDPTLNSTRGLTPGLINPTLGEAGGRVHVPEAYGQRFRAFAKQQQKLIQKLSMMKQDVMLDHTFATKQDMESRQCFIVQHVVPLGNVPSIVTGIGPPTYSLNKRVTQKPASTAGVSHHEQHGMILEQSEPYETMQGSDNGPSDVQQSYVADIVVDDAIPHIRVSQKQIEEGEIAFRNSDGISMCISQNMQNNIQSESDDSEMTDIYDCNSGGYGEERNSESRWEARHWSGSETTIPDGSDSVPIIPLEDDTCPGIPYYGGPLEVEKGLTTPTKARVSQVPIKLMMQQYIDIPYCWKTEMFEAMRTIQAGMPPIHPNDTLQGQMVADEWELFPTIPGPPCDYLEFSDPREEPTEYEKMERVMNYQREYDIDIDYCEELRALYGQNTF
ncbi:hypothetical protein AJ78_08691, partial [Emergomyces pasteurianus Ep9510]